MTVTPERRREIARLGGLARARQFTPDSQSAAGKSRAKAFDAEYQRAARSHIDSAECARRGHLSFDRLVARKGRAGALEHLANYRREHPTSLERRVMEWLDAHGVAYKREVSCAGVWVDFLLDDGTSVLMVDGRMWHTMDDLHRRDYAGRDAIQDMALEANGYRVLRLTESDINSGAAFERLEREL